MLLTSLISLTVSLHCKTLSTMTPPGHTGNANWTVLLRSHLRHPNK